jgi:DNA adenine methylase
MSFFRYPGGKSKLKNKILQKLQSELTEYREPFFGGGSIGINFLESNPQIKKIWINDKDIGISSLWTSVINHSTELKNKIKEFHPTVQDFDDFKRYLLNVAEPEDVVDCGFKKLAIHQISYSGLGTKSGTALGGKEQKSIYKIDCRWSPDFICKKIDKLNKLFSKFEIHENKCTNYDFSKMLDLNDSIIYLDPPYYVKGNELYQHGFNNEDHKRLSDHLKENKSHWVLSYDDCEEIRDLYNWAKIEDLTVNYTIKGSTNKKEILICGKNNQPHQSCPDLF